MRIKLSYRMERITFFHYWKTFHSSSFKPMASRVYRKLVGGLCLEPLFDKPDKFRARAVLFDVSYVKQQQLFARLPHYQ